MLDLTTLRKGKQNRPPRVVVYGPHGIGKSTFANEAQAVFIPTEDGLTNIDLHAGAFPLCQSLQDVYAALGALAEQKHDHGAVAIDTLDWLERLVHAEICRREKVDSIERAAGGYGKGYKLALDEWHRLFDALDVLRDKGMAVILLAHARVVEYANPMGENFDRYQLDLHSSKSLSTSARVMEWADAVLFASNKTFTRKTKEGDERAKKDAKHIGVGGVDRVLFTEERPSHQAKNRYNLPYELPLSWAAFVEALKG
jgi:energy-coupling factor transporter ATP-binding protein EcfA2